MTQKKQQMMKIAHKHDFFLKSERHSELSPKSLQRVTVEVISLTCVNDIWRPRLEDKTAHGLGER